MKNNVSAWAVYRNGKDLGIIETNFPFASKYWSQKCTHEARYALRPVHYFR